MIRKYHNYKLQTTLRFLPKGMTYAKPILMVKTALYQNDVQFGDKSIPFQMVKCITREFKDILHLSSIPFGSKLL